MTKDQQRFAEIITNIDNLIEEAINIIPENMVAKSKSYWYAHIMCAVSDDHEFLGILPFHKCFSMVALIQNFQVICLLFLKNYLQQD